MAAKPAFKLADDEVVFADATSPLSTMVFPLLEMIVITGVCWGVVGFMDAHLVSAGARNLVVALWAMLGVFRFLLPLVGARRRRFLVTDRRVVARSSTGAVDSIPLRDIHSARRDRGGIMLTVYGFDRPLYFSDVGRTRRVEKVLHARLSRR